MKKSNTIKINIFLIIGISFLFVLIIFKMIKVGTFNMVDNINLNEFASNRDIVTKKLRAERGTIYDRNGEVLARNVNSYTIIAYLSKSRTKDINRPNHVVDKEKTAESLSPIINMKKEDILKLLNMKLYQVELGPGGRGLSELAKEQIEKLNLPGIDFIANTKRYYPYGDFMSYTLGYAKNVEKGDIVGEFGIELKYDDKLTGINGYHKYQQDIYGYKIVNTPDEIKKPVNGKDIYLTLDANLQLLAEQAVNDIDKYNPEWTIVTVANAKTGEILASATNPSFNPNIKNIKSYYDPLVSYAYEPGSTMKIFSFMAAMENGEYNGLETYKSGNICVSDVLIQDWNDVGWGTINFDTGFLASSNVAATILSQRTGKNKLLDFYKKLGFGSITNVGLPNERKGKVDFKYDLDVASASFGQSILVTPIQLIKASTVLANNGRLLEPYIVDKIVDSKTGKIDVQNKRKEIGNFVSKDSINKMKELMWGVVNAETHNTGSGYKILNYDLMGKTGTAQIASKNGGYLKGNYNLLKSFVEVFPKDDPEVIIYVASSKLKGGNFYKTIKTLTEDVSKYLNIYEKLENQNDLEEVKLKSLVNKKYEEVYSDLNDKLNIIKLGDGDKIIKQYPNKNTVLNLKDKLFLLTNGKEIKLPSLKNYSREEVKILGNLIDLRIEYDGYGYVISQSIQANTVLKKEDILTVKLSPKYILEGKKS